MEDPNYIKRMIDSALAIYQNPETRPTSLSTIDSIMMKLLRNYNTNRDDIIYLITKNLPPESIEELESILIKAMEKEDTEIIDLIIHQYPIILSRPSTIFAALNSNNQEVLKLIVTKYPDVIPKYIQYGDVVKYSTELIGYLYKYLDNLSKLTFELKLGNINKAKELLTNKINLPSGLLWYVEKNLDLKIFEFLAPYYSPVVIVDLVKNASPDILKYIINQYPLEEDRIKYLLTFNKIYHNANNQFKLIMRPETWAELIWKIYLIPSPLQAKDKYGLIREYYPNLNILDGLENFQSLSDDIVNDALVWLQQKVERELAKKYQPGGMESKEAIDRNDLASGQLSLECNGKTYEYLQKLVINLLEECNGLQICQAIAKFGDKLNLGEHYSTYTIQDYFEVLMELVQVLVKKDLCSLIAILGGEIA
jgi:hypothetical protein